MHQKIQFRRFHWLFLVVFFSGYYRSIQGETLYVDLKLSADCIGTYSVSKRAVDSNGGKKGFQKVQSALNYMHAGDIILLRGGAYRQGHITIPLAKNGTSWAAGKFNKIASYPGEWAILDGENKLPDFPYNCVIGRPSNSKIGEHDMKYWIFDSLEICNGKVIGGKNAVGFWGNGGPFIFRNCYIHDNLADIENNLPAGLTGTVWNSCIIENCHFVNNGCLTGVGLNSAHIMIVSDYRKWVTMSDGFNDLFPSTKKNEIRYNYFDVGADVGIMYKSAQLFCGRNPGAGKGYDDTYKDYGDHIHHNIFKNNRGCAINSAQDFQQIYNNIFDSSTIFIGHSYPTRYKTIVYNNTLIAGDIQWHHMHRDNNTTYPYEKNIFAYGYNNIVANGPIKEVWNREEMSVYTPLGFTDAEFDGLNLECNYFYMPNKHVNDPTGTQFIFMGNSKLFTSPRFTLANYKSLEPNDIQYLNQSSSDLLFQGTTGSSRYKTRGDHKLSSKTVATGGVGGVHPFLKTALPSYVGATNPTDAAGNKWIDAVLGLIPRVSIPTPVEPIPVEPKPSDPVSVNKAPVVSTVSAGYGSEFKPDSLVVVRWKSSDDIGIAKCSIYVSINDSAYKAIGLKAGAIDSINWKIPKTASSVQFKVRAFDNMQLFGDNQSVKYGVRVTNTVISDMRIYAYTIDSTRVSLIWRSKVNSTLSKVGFAYRTDRFALNPSESGYGIKSFNTSSGETIITNLRSNRNYYFTIFSCDAFGVWSNPLDSIKVITVTKIALPNVPFSDTLMVPFNVNDIVAYNMVCTKGDGKNAVAGTITPLTSVVNGKKTVVFTVPASVVSDTFGFYGNFIAKNSNYCDTVYISRQVKRLNKNYDNFIAYSDLRSPISVTAMPDSSALASYISYVLKPQTDWKYDPAKVELTQWAPVSATSMQNRYYSFTELGDAVFTLNPGNLFWIKSDESLRFDFGSAVTPALYGDVQINLNGAGWTELSIPNANQISLRDISNASSVNSAPVNFDSLEIYKWVRTNRRYVSTPVYLPGILGQNPENVKLQGGPLTGYSIFNREKGIRSLYVPAIPSGIAQSAKLAKTASITIDSSDWNIRIDALMASGDTLGSCYFGYSSAYQERFYQAAPSFDDIQMFIFDKVSNQMYGHVLTGNADAASLSFKIAVVNKSQSKDTIKVSIGSLVGIERVSDIVIYDGIKGYLASDTVPVILLPMETRYLTVMAGNTSIIGEKAGYSVKSGFSHVYRSENLRGLTVQFGASPDVTNASIEMFTLSGKSMGREQIRNIKASSMNTVSIYNGKTISNGSYILKLILKNRSGNKEMHQIPFTFIK